MKKVVTLEFTRSMEQLCGQVAEQMGVDASFVPLPVPASIYGGSPLADGLARDFPQTVTRPGPYVGESAILSSSPGVGADVVQRYEAEIYGHERYTPRASELVDFYFPVPKDFAAAHPELTDEQGVTLLCNTVCC